MRKFTKQHNELQWLFPICESEEQASKHFDTIEDEANDLLEMCYGEQQTFTRDDMIDAFMKGNSRATRMIGYNIYQLKSIIKSYDDVDKANNRLINNYREQIKTLEEIVKIYDSMSTL